MGIVLREYQEEMVSSTLAAMPIDQFILLMAGTGAGKTIFFCTLIQRLLEKWPGLRIAILAHRGLLVTQALLKLIKVWPEGKGKIGIASRSVNSRVNVNAPVTIGTIQTLISRTEKTAPFDIIIIDEVHRVAPKNTKSQYQSFLKTMTQYNQNVRVIGLTATPFRLGHGYIYSTMCRPGKENWFPHLHYRVGIKELQEKGFLCEYRAKEVVNIESDLKTISVSGDYNIGELSDIMSQNQQLGSALHAFETYAADRKHILIFCVTIEHAEKLKELFAEKYKTACIHSKMPKGQCDMILREFEAGRIRIVCNVGMLTEGWDSPAVDCILMCRPTKSAALYVQMAGRGLRPHKDKTDVLILDLANNCREHGDPNNPEIPIPNRQSKKTEAILKACPKCFELMPVAAKICKGCGYQWPVEIIEENGSPEMQDIKWGEAIENKPFNMDVKYVEISEHISKKGNRMVKVSLSNDSFINRMEVNEFMMFDPDSHPFARGKAIQTWISLVKTEPPRNVDEALDRHGELEMSIPPQIQVIEDGRWLKVYKWYGEKTEETLNCKKCGDIKPIVNKVSNGPHSFQAVCPNCYSHLKWVSKEYGRTSENCAA